MITRQGIIKRTALSAFDNVRKKGVIALGLRDEDELVCTVLTDGDRNLLVATHDGKAILFPESQVREMGRTAAGVRSIRLRDGDAVVGMVAIADDGSKVLTISENGFGRVSPIDNYRLQSRGGQGIKNYRSEIGAVAAVRIVNDDDDIIIINDAGVIIRIAVSEIRVCARPSKGVRVMRMADDIRIVAIACVEHDDEAEHAKAEDTEDADDVGEPDEAEALDEEPDDTAEADEADEANED